MSTSYPVQITATPQTNAPQIVNENLAALGAAVAFAKRFIATSGLTWAYYGCDDYNGNAVADGSLTLTDNATNYVVVLRSTGAVSVSTATTNSTNPLYARLYKLTTLSGVVTAVVDERLKTNGLMLAPAAPSTTQVDQWSLFIAAPSNKDYRIVLDCKYACTIEEITTRSASGTCTLTGKINTTALGGTSNSVSSTETTQTKSSPNSLAAGDDFVLTVSSNSTCVDMSVTIKVRRTLA